MSIWGLGVALSVGFVEASRVAQISAPDSGSSTPDRLFQLARLEPDPALPTGAQRCNTRCQSEQTDCAVRCDGEVSCIQGCQKVADSCVEKCSTPTPPPAAGASAP
ncbi:MAG TPA: hypothetical protein VFQ61_02795 [Polyangiaceae bacterium]|nr:hypothetical protein [Polyangiaceae bacterium]